MKKITYIISLFFALCLMATSQLAAQPFNISEVPNDPLKAKMVTLDNGLKVYLTVYKDAPRIQCYIAVKVGSKNDPKETTGLAHYFEHLMFKGTPNFGTTDFAKEKVLLDTIEELFEIYRAETAPEKRNEIYARIDSFSYEASKLAIPNEYDKIMKFIGSQGTNAATSNDYTYYVENIPSNQLETWAYVQADRFQQPILRLFHTELETVYEEKNMSLTNDSRKVNETMLAALFPNHPYGQQTTLGEAEHLKNPSIKNIRRFYENYYVPNNMAICLSGDFDVNEALNIINKHFGKLQAKPVKKLQLVEEQPITSPIVKEVVGLEAEFVRIAFRIGQPANSKEIYILDMMDNILANGKSGLIDLNLNQKQAVFSASAYPYVLCDNSAYVLYGKPKSGQTLDDVKELLLAQLDLIKKGDFDDDLMTASINNMRLQKMRQMESNQSRAMMMAQAFMNNIDWADAAHELDRYAEITKEDVVKFANKYFNEKNYVVVYKRQGTPPDVAKVNKPAITPIFVNREAESDFFAEIKQRKTERIAPVFVDFEKEITFDYYKGAPIYYLQNVENQTFSLRFRFPVGEMHDLKLPFATAYFDYLGTSEMTPEAIKQEFYKLACDLRFASSDDYTDITISGLSENCAAALELSMKLLRWAQPNQSALDNLIADVLKQRADAKSNQNAVLNALRSYCEYGEELVKYTLSEEQLKALTPQDLIATMTQLLRYQPEIIYYGTASMADLQKMLNTNFRIMKKFETPPAEHKFEHKPVTENAVFFAPYNAKQARLVTYSRGNLFNKEIVPIANMYNQYFGGGMNAIVFQEMREKRSLAYSAQSRYVIPSKMDEHLFNFSFIATQNDKVVDAFDAFNELFDEIPQSENAFNLAKEGAKTSIETNRITKANILYRYLSNRKLGYKHDYRKDYYDVIDGFKLADVVAFNQKYVKGQPKIYMILSREEDLNWEEIEKKFGKVTKLGLETIFGY